MYVQLLLHNYEHYIPTSPKGSIRSTEYSRDLEHGTPQDALR
jgi:hypothetical protein